MLPQVNRRALYTFLSALIVFTGTLMAIRYAQGQYRVTQGGLARESGLLSANSFPSGAEVTINGRLVTATDDTIYLEPGTYTVEINKDGYSPWRKTLQIEKELVTQTNAQLFRMAPGLTSLTFSGAQNISPSPDGQKLMYYTASASSELKNGLYVIELTNSPLSLQRGPRQIADDVPELDLDHAEYIWSPDSSQIMVLTKNKEMLLDAGQKNDLRTAADISLTKRQILSGWEEDMYIRERQFLGKFPPEIIAIATQSAKNVYLSPDKKRMLYTATASAYLPEPLVPPIPATNTQPQERLIQPGVMYIYDREEDKNFRIGQELRTEATISKALLATDLYSNQPRTLVSSPSAFRRLQASSSAETAHEFKTYYTSLFANTHQWFPDSKHLLYTLDGRINVVGYDGTNDTTIYSGPFASEFIYPWPDGSKVLIMTSFSTDSPANIYAIELK